MGKKMTVAEVNAEMRGLVFDEVCNIFPDGIQVDLATLMVPTLDADGNERFVCIKVSTKKKDYDIDTDVFNWELDKEKRAKKEAEKAARELERARAKAEKEAAKAEKEAAKAIKEAEKANTAETLAEDAETFEQAEADTDTSKDAESNSLAAAMVKAMVESYEDSITE